MPGAASAPGAAPAPLLLLLILILPPLRAGLAAVRPHEAPADARRAPVEPNAPGARKGSSSGSPAASGSLLGSSDPRNSSLPGSSPPSASLLDSLDPTLRGLVEQEMQDVGLGPELWAGGPLRARRRRRRRPLLWIHIHKSAGSTICGLAVGHGEKAIEPSNNCDWQGHDNCCDAGHVPCEERIAKFKEQGATWGAIERVITQDDLCPQFFSYGVLLRDPNELALSAFAFHEMDSKTVLESLDCVAHNRTCNMGSYEGWSSGCHEIRGQKSWYGQPLWWWFDNIVVRTLGGEEVRSLPVRGIKKEHYLRALAVAERMDVVILLDEIRKSTAVLKQAFGWELPEETPRSNPSAEKRRTELTGSQLQLAKRTNKWDYKLYNHFRKMPLPSRLRPLT